MLWVAGGRNGSGRKVANDVTGSKPNCWNAVHGHSAGGQEWKQIAFILLLLCMLPCAHPARLSNTKFHSLLGHWENMLVTPNCVINCRPYKSWWANSPYYCLLIIWRKSECIWDVHLISMELDYLYIFWGSPRPAHVTQALQPNGHVTSLGLWVPEAVGVPDSAGVASKLKHLWEFMSYFFAPFSIIFKK